MSAAGLKWSVAALLLVASTAATGYLLRGHYNTLLAIYWTNSPVPVRLQKIVEAFCTELPDYSVELDAYQQRKRVFFAKDDWRWGFSTPGYCSTKVSRHMALSHYYLHGLTDLPAVRVRAAARDIVAAVDVQLKTATDSPPVDLWCVRGFAAHLLGDTFAHTRLTSFSWLGSARSDEKLYATGTGHGGEGDRPDHMFSRDKGDANDWRRWVEEANRTLDSAGVAGNLVGSLRDKVAGGWFTTNKSLESRVDSELSPTKMDSGLWQPYDFEKKTIVACDKTIQSWVNGTTDPAFASVRNNPPRCEAVWRIYLALAHAAFLLRDADPVEVGAFAPSCQAGSFSQVQPPKPETRASLSDQARNRLVRDLADHTKLVDQLKDGKDGE